MNTICQEDRLTKRTETRDEAMLKAHAVEALKALVGDEGIGKLTEMVTSVSGDLTQLMTPSIELVHQAEQQCTELLQWAWDALDEDDRYAHVFGLGMSRQQRLDELRRRLALIHDFRDTQIQRAEKFLSLQIRLLSGIVARSADALIDSYVRNRVRLSTEQALGLLTESGQEHQHLPAARFDLDQTIR